MAKYRNKWYWKIPYGEIQYGRVTRSIHVWFRGKLYTIRKGKWNTRRYRKVARNLYR